MSLVLPFLSCFYVLDNSHMARFFLKICKISIIKLKCVGTFGGKCRFDNKIMFRYVSVFCLDRSGLWC